jgi:hypothetical protein
MMWLAALSLLLLAVCALTLERAKAKPLRWKAPRLGKGKGKATEEWVL